MKNPFVRWFEYFRKSALRRGYACDLCGKELFDYPVHRICEPCEGKLRTPARPCPKCGREGIAEGLCMDCKSNPPLCTQGFSALVYKGESAAVVNRLKNGQPRLAAYLGERMAACFLEAGVEKIDEPLLVIPVPLSKEKRRERGYNQAERLAESVCDFLFAQGGEGELTVALLEKRRETKPQKQMSFQERTENVRGAFKVTDRKAVEGRTVVLVDDILTTGATGNECARKLFAAGAKKVYFLTAAAVAEKK